MSGLEYRFTSGKRKDTPNAQLEAAHQARPSCLISRWLCGVLCMWITSSECRFPHCNERISDSNRRMRIRDRPESRFWKRFCFPYRSADASRSWGRKDCAAGCAPCRSGSGSVSSVLSCNKLSSPFHHSSCSYLSVRSCIHRAILLRKRGSLFSLFGIGAIIISQDTVSYKRTRFRLKIYLFPYCGCKCFAVQI